MFLFAPLGIAGLIGAGVCFFSSGCVDKANKQKVININDEYDAKITAGHKQIDGIIAEWKNAKEIVAGFESHDIPDIVA